MEGEHGTSEWGEEEIVHEIAAANNDAVDERVLTTTEQFARKEVQREANSTRRTAMLVRKTTSASKKMMISADKIALRMTQSNKATTRAFTRGVTSSRALARISKNSESALYGRSRYRRRRTAALTRAARFVPSNEDSLEHLRGQMSSTLTTFISRISNYLAPATPLSFERIDTNEDNFEKEEEILDEDNLRSDFYAEEFKLSMQYVESVSLYIPRLMSLILGRRARREDLKSLQAKGAILGIYWSIRIYLSSDESGIALKAKDNHYFRLEENRNIMNTRAKEQPYTRISRYNLRHRLQPAEVLSAPNTEYFDGDWLRWALPTFHELYQEDARKYGHLLIDLRHVEHIVPNVRGMANARTVRGTTSLDRRAFYLYTLTRLRSSPQLETVLRTTRREVPEFSATEHVVKPGKAWVARNMPWIAHYVGRSRAVSARKLSRRKRLRILKVMKTVTRRWIVRGIPSLIERFSGIEPKEITEKVLYVFNIVTKMRSNFFARNVHTRTARELGGVSNLLFSYGRLLRDSEYEHSAFTKFCARAYIKEHVVARNSSGYTSNLDDGEESGSFSSLAADQTRQKSSHNRQYLLRQGEEMDITRAEQLRYPLTLTPSSTTEESSRDERKFIYTHSSASEQNEWLRYYRERALSYRLNTGLNAPRVELKSEREQKSALNFPNRAEPAFHPARTKKENTIRQERAQQLRAARTRASYDARSYFYKMEGRVIGAFNTFRQAKKRTTWISLPKERSIPSIGVLVQKGVREQAERYQLKSCVLSRLKLRIQRLGMPILRSGIVVKSRIYRLVQILNRRIAIASARMLKQTSGPRIFTKRDQVIFNEQGTDAERDFVYFANRSYSLISLEEERQETLICLEIESLECATFDRFRGELYELLTALPSKKLRLARRWLGFFKKNTKDDWIHEGVHFENRGEDSYTLEMAQAVRPSIFELFTVKRLRTAKEKQETRWLEERTKKNGAFVPETEPFSLIPADNFVDLKTVRHRLHDVKHMTWKERSDTFIRSWQKYSRTLYNAFSFPIEERLRIRWLEGELFNRALYSTNHGELRRHHMPGEQKRFKRGHAVRRHLYAIRSRNVFMKRKRRHTMRRMNMRLHLELFGLRDVRAAKKHFRTLRRRSRPSEGAFAHLQKGLMTRLSCVLLQMNLAPTAWWSETIARFGVVRVNNRVVNSPSYQLKAGDTISINHEILEEYTHWFTPPNQDSEEISASGDRWSFSGHTENLITDRGVDTILFSGAAREEELTPTGRLQAQLFRAAALDASGMSRRTITTRATSVNKKEVINKYKKGQS